LTRRLNALILLPFILALFFVSPAITKIVIPPVHAAQPIGEVCITDTAATQCPINPETLTGTVGTQLRVAVFINGSAALSNFDITLFADHTKLLPSDALNNGFFSGGTQISKCIGGVNKQGTNPCPPWAQSADTMLLDLAGSLTVEPFTGLLFTAVYNITGTTTTTPINFQTGCGSSTSAPPLCVSVSSGGVTNIQETVQTGSFSNLPYYSMTTSVAQLTLFRGATDSSTIVTLTSLNGFTGIVALTTSVSGPSNLQTSVGPPTALKVTPVQPNNTILTITAAAGATVGANSVTIFGTSTGVPPNSVTIRVTVPLPDFTITASVFGFNMNATTSRNVTITVDSTGGFSGIVNLAKTVSNPTNITATLSKSSITLGTSDTSILTITSASEPPYNYGSYTVTVTGASGGFTHSATINLVVVDFGISASVTSLSMIQGSPGGLSLTFAGLPGDSYVHGTITLAATVVPTTGLTVSCTPLKINFTGGTVIGQSPSCGFSASKPGSFQATFTGTYPIGTSTSLVHSITVPVTVTGPDFTVTPVLSKFPGIIASAQTTNSTNIIIAEQARFNGTVALFVSSNPTGPIVTLSKYSVMVNTTVQSVNVLLTIQTPSTVSAGNYTITVSGISGVLTHNANVTLSVVDFTITTKSTTIGPLLPSVTTNINVTIGPINHFQSTVSLATLPQSGLTVSPGSTTITILGPRQVLFTVSATSLGTYTLIIIATHGPKSHNVTITITVNARPDLAIGQVTVSPASVSVGAKITYTVVVENLGTIPENATVVALVGDQTVDSKTITLQPNSNQTITLVWNTNGFTAGAYVVGAKVLQVPNESNLDNNLMRSPVAVTLTPPSNTGILSLSTDQSNYVILGIIVAALAAAIVVLLFRKSKVPAAR
jgi:hypothetical protein